RIAIPVLAGEVDDHLLTSGDQVGPEGVGRKHRVPSGVVGDREHVDPWIRGEVARESQDPRASVRRNRPSARDELGSDDERARLREPFAERHQRARHAPISMSGVPWARTRAETASRIAAPASATALSALSMMFTSTKKA